MRPECSHSLHRKDRSRKGKPVTADYEILLQGNNLRLREGFLGLANVSLIHTTQGPMLFDALREP